MRVSISVDFEPDCPPYLSSTFRGIEEGAPKLLSLFSELKVPVTYFTTAVVAHKYPERVRDVVAAGHELGCHGVTHTAFDTLDESVARWEIEHASAVLREFGTISCFRAPYLRFPERFLVLLEDNGIAVDSSLAKYKRAYHAQRAPSAVRRIAASATSSVLRLPHFIRDPWLLSLRDPVVLFVHPWEFVDLRHERLRLDCRFRTGDLALSCLRSAIELLRGRGASFHTIGDLAENMPR